MRLLRPMLVLLLTCALGAVPGAAFAHDTPGDHGVDTPEDIGFDITESVAQQQLADLPGTSMAGSGALPITWCGTERTTDDTVNATFNAALPQFKVIYAYPADRPNRFSQWSELLQANASLITSFVSGQNGSSKAPRFDLGTSCGAPYLDIQVVKLPSTRTNYVQNFTNVKNAIAPYLNPSPGGIRDYVVIADTMSSGSINGQGQLYAGMTAATRPDSGNIHNNGGLTSILWVPDVALPNSGVNPGWYPTVMLHEMGHNMGAVQWNAPHTSQKAGSTNYVYSHCWDGYDVMCYQDGPSMSKPYTTSVCAALTGQMYQTLDCNQDDYFNPAPAPGSYLASNWNLYNSVFLAECNTLPDGACTNTAPAGPPSNQTSPSISGLAARGRTLSTDVGEWDPAGSNYAYQWQRDPGTGWVNITGATTRTYVPASTDIGANLRVQVTALNSLGTAAATSASVGPVATSPPTADVTPTVTGTAQRMQKLTATAGTWSPSGATFTYQWQRDPGTGWVNISAATATTYTLAAADVNAKVRVVVTAKNVDGSVSAASAATDTVAPLLPTAAVTPVITGTLKRASQLSVSTGTWTPSGATLAYQWQRDLGEGAGWENIPAAITTKYTLTSTDIGAIIRARVTATNSDGSTVAYTAATTEIQPAPPAPLTAPAVSGTMTTGSTLTTTAGTWTPTGPTYAYQWQRDDGSGWQDISGATAATYTLVLADAGSRIRSKITATNVDGATANTSAQTAVIIETPANTAAPTISGTLMDTYTLTADPGTWTPSGATFTYKYQWLRCPVGASVISSSCAVVATTTTPTYTLVAADVTRPMAVRVTATQQGASGIAASALTSPVEGRPLDNTSKPAITLVNALTQVQEPLKGSSGTWSVPTTAIAYQWRRCDATDPTVCTDITNAKSVSYTPVAADAGSKLVLKVTATSPGRTTTVTSDPTDVVAPLPPPANKTVPTITGVAQRLQALRVTGNGTWSAYPTGFAYQWLRCDAAGDNCDPIDGAIASGYTLVLADVGKTIRLSVTARNAAGTGTAVSAQSAVVGAVPPANVTLPSIAGTKQVGKAMSVTLGTWSGGRDTTFTYAWQRCSDGTASDCTAIDGATKATYVAVAADAGKRLRVVVTGTNPDGSATATTAVTTAILPAAPVNSVLPKVTGTATVGQTLTAESGTWANPVTTKQIRFYRCTTTCAAVGTLGQTSYVLTTLDAGKRIRITETATGPGGTATVWASTIIGPIASATSGSALLSAGGSVSVKTAKGQVVGLASATTAAAPRAAAGAASAGAQTVVSVKRAARVKGTWKAWACAVPVAGEELPPCTKPVKLKAGKAVKVTPLPGRKVHVVVARR